MVFNYEKDVTIDESALDVEWLEQSKITLKYGKNWKTLQSQQRIAEEHVKVTRSELFQEVYSDPVGCCGKEKPTAGDIEAYYRTHDRHIKAKEKLNQIIFETDCAEIAYYAIRDKKYALQSLVQLHGQNYFAGPSVPRDLQKEVSTKKVEKNREVNNLKNAGMRRKKEK